LNVHILCKLTAAQVCQAAQVHRAARVHSLMMSMWGAGQPFNENALRQ